MILNTSQLKQLKREVKNRVESLDDIWVIDGYYKGYDTFNKQLERLNKIPINRLSIEEIHFLSFINKIDKYNLEFIFKYI